MPGLADDGGVLDTGAKPPVLAGPLDVGPKPDGREFVLGDEAGGELPWLAEEGGVFGIGATPPALAGPEEVGLVADGRDPTLDGEAGSEPVVGPAGGLVNKELDGLEVEGSSEDVGGVTVVGDCGCGAA